MYKLHGFRTQQKLAPLGFEWTYIAPAIRNKKHFY